MDNLSYGGGWRDSVVAYIRREALPVDKFGHQPRLYSLCIDIAGNLPGECDDDVLFAAAWMHDLGVFLGHRPTDPAQLEAWEHVPYTVARSTELLERWGFPKDKLRAVAEAIRTHQAKDNATMPEAIVLRDADILEQLGAVGILRAVVKVGRDTRYSTFSEVTIVIKKALESLPSQLKTTRAIELAAARIAVVEAFLHTLQNEAGMLLF